MKILILGSMSFTPEMVKIGEQLKNLGHKVTLPCFIEEYSKCNTREEMHNAAIKNKLSYDLYKEYYNLIKETDAIIIINEEKNKIPNYIGANSLIEMSFAHILGKKIFLLNDIPNMPYSDEIKAMNIICLKKDFSKIK